MYICCVYTYCFCCMFLFFQTVEKFFSKEIRYLVSSKPEARHVQRLVHDSPVPSPDSGLSSPHPGSRRDSHSHRGSSQGPADTVRSFISIHMSAPNLHLRYMAKRLWIHIHHRLMWDFPKLYRMFVVFCWL